MTHTASTFASLVSSHIGQTVMADQRGVMNAYRIAKLSDKLGKLKDGTQAEYLVLVSVADESITMSLHPRSAMSLLKNGAEAGMTLVAPEVAAEQTTAAATDVPADAPADKKADKPAKEEKVKEPSKKELFMAIYTPAVAAGKTRKEIKVAVAALELSDAGFNTYYQNAKSAKWA